MEDSVFSSCRSARIGHFCGISPEKEQKIVDTVLSNGVPKKFEEYLDDENKKRMK